MKEPVRITSRDNRHLKFARRVRDGKEPDYIFVEGSRLCEEALRSNTVLDRIFYSEDFFNSHSADVMRYGSETDVDTFVLSNSLFGSIADTKTSQGIAIVVHRPESMNLDGMFHDRSVEIVLPVWVFLFEINNPSNLGAALRTAEAAGAKGVVISAGSADAFSPRSLRASAGSAFRLPIVSGADLQETFETAKKNGVRSVAVDARGSVNHEDLDWTRPTLLIFGSEADGLPDNIVGLADESLKIDMDPQVESLNLAVACGIVLFEARRQSKLA